MEPSTISTEQLKYPELMFSRTVKPGDRGRDVKRAQEWLGYHGFPTAIDEDFGPATDACVRRFQAKAGLTESGVVNAPTQSALLSPIVKATAPIAPGNKTLAELTIAYGRQHLNQHPIEIGGENAGPWVRLYMDGHEGREWPWCAGFTMFVLRQAAEAKGVPMPHPFAFGCDYLAGIAQGNGSLLSPDQAAAVKPGYLFLIRKASNKWAHIGLVEAVQGDTMLTIEGNTNDSGSAEGFEVCRRTRAIKDKDYLLV